MTTDRERAEDTDRRMEKLQKKLDEDVVKELEAMSGADLKARIVLCQANLAENERERDADEALAAAKSEYARLAGPYKDAQKLQSKMALYCTLLLEKRGAY